MSNTPTERFIGKLRHLQKSFDKDAVAIDKFVYGEATDSTSELVSIWLRETRVHTVILGFVRDRFNYAKIEHEDQNLIWRHSFRSTHCFELFPSR